MIALFLFKKHKMKLKHRIKKKSIYFILACISVVLMVYPADTLAENFYYIPNFLYYIFLYKAFQRHTFNRRFFIEFNQATWLYEIKTKSRWFFRKHTWVYVRENGTLTVNPFARDIDHSINTTNGSQRNIYDIISKHNNIVNSDAGYKKLETPLTLQELKLELKVIEKQLL